MNRPILPRGKNLPAATGRCALCGLPLGDPREGSIRLLYEPGARPHSVFKLCCRAEAQCLARRKEKGP